MNGFIKFSTMALVVLMFVESSNAQISNLFKKSGCGDIGCAGCDAGCDDVSDLGKRIDTDCSDNGLGVRRSLDLGLKKSGCDDQACDVLSKQLWGKRTSKTACDDQACEPKKSLFAKWGLGKFGKIGCSDAGCSDAAGCGDAAGCSDPGSCAPCMQDPFKLLNTEAINIGGWLQSGYPNRSTNMFNNRPNEFNLHQAYMFAEKVADGSNGLGFGFRMDYVYGIDGPDTQAFGNQANTFDFGFNNGGFYGHAIPQLYGEVAWNDISVKIGHFYTIVGYEVVTAPDNFFYSHSFTMFNSEPFTHTGVLASKQVGEATVYAGWTAGWDTGFSSNGGDTFLGGVTMDVLDNASLAYAVTAGNIGFGGDQSGYSHSLVFDVDVTDRLNYVIQNDYVDYEGPVSGLFNTVGINQYLLYDVTECLGVGTRVEWWQNEVVPGTQSDVYGVTVGMNYKPNANMILRPELRWNRDDDGVIINANDNNKMGFGMDFIYTF